ncbi:hypothetical protein [Psychrobacillus glaciei]|nr:hypothetical protein [Psychrobacillus glaciei]
MLLSKAWASFEAEKRIEGLLVVSLSATSFLELVPFRFPYN